MSKELVKPARILTEEELDNLAKRCGDMLNEGTFNLRESRDIEAIIISHRELLSANATLSFKNMEQRKTIDHQHILLDKYESMINGG